MVLILTQRGGKIAFCMKIDDVTNLNDIEAWVRLIKSVHAEKIKTFCIVWIVCKIGILTEKRRGTNNRHQVVKKLQEFNAELNDVV